MTKTKNGKIVLKNPSCVYPVTQSYYTTDCRTLKIDIQLCSFKQHGMWRKEDEFSPARWGCVPHDCYTEFDL